MVDQVTNLQQRGEVAGILDGHSAASNGYTAAVSHIHQYRILFCGPEAAICAGRWREMVSNNQLSEHIIAVAVDAGHCVSKW